MGPSGSGKSTLMHFTAGLDTVTGGTVWVGDTDLTDAERQGADPAAPGPDRLRLPAVQPGADADRRREHHAADAPRRPRADQAWLDRIIDMVGLGDRLRHRPSELSGGQQQRVAVARALVARPEVVFADEPTGNLDSRSGAEVLSFLRRSVDEIGQTIVMVTHDPVAACYADRVVFLADGRVVDEMTEPTADRVLDRMKNAGGLTGADPDPARAAQPQAAAGLDRRRRPARSRLHGRLHGVHRHHAGQPRRSLRRRRAPDRCAGPRTGHDRGLQRDPARPGGRVAGGAGRRARRRRAGGGPRRGLRPGRRTRRRGRRRHRHGRRSRRRRLDRVEAAQPVPRWWPAAGRAPGTRWSSTARSPTRPTSRRATGRRC